MNGPLTDRLPQNAHLTIDRAPADEILAALPEIALSTGSACSSASPGPSHVLQAIGLSREDIRCSLRIGLSTFTTDEEVDVVVHRLVETVRALRARHGTATRAEAGSSVHSLEHA
jgi:cysteine desulfurase